jgi:hypothetical protein
VRVDCWNKKTENSEFNVVFLVFYRLEYCNPSHDDDDDVLVVGDSTVLYSYCTTT